MSNQKLSPNEVNGTCSQVSGARIAALVKWRLPQCYILPTALFDGLQQIYESGLLYLPFLSFPSQDGIAFSPFPLNGNQTIPHYLYDNMTAQETFLYFGT